MLYTNVKAFIMKKCLTITILLNKSLKCHSHTTYNWNIMHKYIRHCVWIKILSKSRISLQKTIVVTKHRFLLNSGHLLWEIHIFSRIPDIWAYFCVKLLAEQFERAILSRSHTLSNSQFCKWDFFCLSHNIIVWMRPMSFIDTF